MLGYAVLAGGALLIWVAATGKTDKLFQALNVQLPNFASSSPTGSSSGNSSNSNNSSSSNSDSGTHMGIDQNGNLITINSTYGGMTPEQKDAANKFAHQFPNGQ